ncbi:hypothetical protein [Streptomyces sp. NPDC050564]|uniref:hypothetical protein n=1 Tax=Streptomyces sp. NPDC050564 TaxID=3365631 RepID=UPI0037AEDC41
MDSGAKGNKGGHRPAIKNEKTDAVRATYMDGRSIAALAREHGVSRDAIRAAAAGHEAAQPRSCRSPSTCRASRRLPANGRTGPVERVALDQGVT